MMVWSWCEHLRAAEQLGLESTRQVVLLFDEIEAHLHPRWQRAVVPAVLKAMNKLSAACQPKIQLLAATHSPLVLASLETFFEADSDRLFHLDLRDEQVILHEEHWVKQGDVVNWLVSDTFGLRQGRSVDAERAIEAAEASMRNDSDALRGLDENLRDKGDIHRELQRVLPGHDPFWPRWVVRTETERDMIAAAIENERAGAGRHRRDSRG